MDPDQRALFDEAMAADLAAVETQLEALQSPGALGYRPPTAALAATRFCRSVAFCRTVV